MPHSYFAAFNLITTDIIAFRGAFASTDAKGNELFHNHDNSIEGKGKHKSLYPLIQYRIHWVKKKPHAAIYALNEGALALEKICNNQRLLDAFEINGQSFPLRTIEKEKENNITVTKMPRGQWQNYYIENYVPLNNSLTAEDKAEGGVSNLAYYKSLPDMVSKIKYLETLIPKHIISSGGGMQLELPTPIKITITDISEIDYREMFIRTPHFNLTIKTNIILPHLLSIGNFKAFNCGVLNKK